MKDTNFTIKVSDFLTGSALEDNIQLFDKFSTSLPQLHDWISCDVCIKNWDEKTVFLEISNISYSLENACDVCSTKYIQHWDVSDIFLKCYADYDKELLREDELSFDGKHGKIDLEDTLTQEITLTQELKKMCSICGDKKQIKTDQTLEWNSIKRIIQQ